MSAEEYEEGRLHRETLGEAIARAFVDSTNRNAKKYALPPVMTWEEMPDNVKESMKAAFLDLVDTQVIVPFAVVNNLRIEIEDIKRTWKTLNTMMEVK